MRQDLKDALKSGSRIAYRPLLGLGICLGIWLALCETGMVSQDSASGGTMIVAVLLFFLAIPFSIVFRLDLLYYTFPSTPASIAVLVAFAYVAANFFWWGILRALWKQRAVLRKKTEAVPKPRIAKVTSTTATPRSSQDLPNMGPTLESERPPPRKFGSRRDELDVDEDVDLEEKKDEDDGWKFH